jgi:S-adenosylmethionine synthetase
MLGMEIRNLARPRGDFEVVERKSFGHPDTLCDAIAERASVLYARHCLGTFNRVPHHWFDKVMLIGGEAEIRFGGGRLLSPFHVIFAGKAVTRIGGQILPLTDILSEAATQVLSAVLTNFNPSVHLRVENRIRDSRGPGQSPSRYRPDSVVELERPGDHRLTSNDCNLCVGFAPFSVLEGLVIHCDKFLWSQDLRTRLPWLGSDIKLVGTRIGEKFSLLINIPFIADRVASFSEYLDKKQRLEDELAHWAANFSEPPPALIINPESRANRAYLTITGTVADTGDVGVTGRGNRINGLITPMRPMSIEAAAGKNPLDHTGKLYSIAAQRIARDIAEETAVGTTAILCSAKGTPLSEPEFAGVELDSQSVTPHQVRVVNSIVKRHLESIADISEELISSEVMLW